jgi:hypothetical protein
MRLCPRCGVQIATTHDGVAADVSKNETYGEEKLETSLVRSLDDEIEYIKKEGGSRFHQIRNGERLTEVAGSFVYRFDFDGDRLETDVPVLLQIGDLKNRVEAEIISVVGQEIMLAVKSMLPESVPKAKMFTDPIFILERLRNLIKSPPQNFNKALAHRLLAEDQPKLGRVPIGGPSDLNESQISAVEHSAGSEVFFIWGPPGTGKTKTISSVISHCFVAGGRVLITSNTNVAVDNAISSTEKLIHKDIHRNDSNAFPGDIVRVGVPQVDVPSCVLLDQIVKQRRKEIDEEISELERENEPFLRRIEQLQHDLGILDEYERLNSRVASSQADLDQLQKNLGLSDQWQRDVEQRLDKAKAMSKIGRAVRGVNVDRLAAELDNSIRRHHSLQEQLLSAQEMYTHAVAALDPIRSQASKIVGKRTQIVQESTDASAKVAQNNSRISELQERRNKIEKEIIAKARIIGTTMAKTWLNAELACSRFDLVVVDEASMATLPMLYFVAGLSSARVLIVGDFKQLPAIAMAKTDHVKQWMKRDIFEVVGINSNTLESKKNICGMLTTQYRMNPDISKIVSKHIYAGRLKDHESVKRGANIDKPPGAGYSLILLDSSNLSPWSTIHDESGSRSNLIHAELAVCMAREGIKNGFTKIGIITPYRAQARILAKRIEDLNLKKYVEVATVHRFQGREKQIVIFDVSDSSPNSPSRMIRVKNSEDNQSERLLNVAISRAQDKLILIGNLSYLTKNLDSDELLPKIIEDCKDNGIQLTAEQVLTYPSEHAEADQTESQEKIVTYRAEEFYPAFESDLTNAKEDIAIVSAFVTARRVRKLTDTLKTAIERKVSVRILTKPPENQFKEEPLKTSARDGVQILQDIGARVEFNPKTHEKLCVIDNSIVWYGSLNILSQYESSESMMRFVGEATARQLLKDVGLRVENVLKPTSFNSIHDGMRGITTTGKLIHIDPVQVRRKRNGPTLKFAEAVLESEGNECNLILWDAETDLVDVGDTVRIINGYTKEFDGKVSLQSGKFGKIEVLQPNNGKKA